MAKFIEQKSDFALLPIPSGVIRNFVQEILFWDKSDNLLLKPFEHDKIIFKP
jgi:hypothetical protein